MPANKLIVDTSTIVDNPETHHVEFGGEVDDEQYDFAVQYAVLEALSGDAPRGDAEEMFGRFEDIIAEAGLVALARDPDQLLIVISESDLE